MARKKEKKTKKSGPRLVRAEEPAKVVSLRKEEPRAVKTVKGALQASQQFLTEVKVEGKKVTWPSRKETLASTAVVLVVVMLVAAYLGLVDVLLSRMIGAIIG